MRAPVCMCVREITIWVERVADGWSGFEKEKYRHLT